MGEDLEPVGKSAQAVDVVAVAVGDERWVMGRGVILRISAIICLAASAVILASMTTTPLAPTKKPQFAPLPPLTMKSLAWHLRLPLMGWTVTGWFRRGRLAESGKLAKS